MNVQIDLERYRNSEQEMARTLDLLRILPRGRVSVLDIGARDGHFSRLLTRYFDFVTALDLERPTFEHPSVTTVSGDVTSLRFPDASFDCVFCAEVLEHVPEVALAAREIARVARHEIVIGVPYKQDTRLGQTTCQACGRVNPAWGHINNFDGQRLRALFPGCGVVSQTFVGQTNEATNALSAWLMNMAGNPWGVYNQQEPCVHCGNSIGSPAETRTLLRRAGCSLAIAMNRVQQFFSPAHGNWIHMVFSKDRM